LPRLTLLGFLWAGVYALVLLILQVVVSDLTERPPMVEQGLRGNLPHRLWWGTQPAAATIAAASILVYDDEPFHNLRGSLHFRFHVLVPELGRLSHLRAQL